MSVYGLEQVVEGGDIVPLRDIVGVAGEKDDLQPLVLLPHFFRQLHAAAPGHLHVQKQDVPGLVVLVLEEEGVAGGEGLYLHGIAPLPGPLGGAVLGQVPGLLLVVAHRDPVVHVSPSFLSLPPL